MKICLNCGATNPTQNEICSQCKSPLETPASYQYYPDSNPAPSQKPARKTSKIKTVTYISLAAVIVGFCSAFLPFPLSFFSSLHPLGLISLIITSFIALVKPRKHNKIQNGNAPSPKFCSNCGAELHTNAVICVKCGYATGYIQRRADDVESGGLNTISFFIPLAGLILYCTNQNQCPQKAKGCGRCALVGFILGFVISIIYIAVLLS